MIRSYVLVGALSDRGRAALSRYRGESCLTVAAIIAFSTVGLREVVVAGPGAVWVWRRS